MTATKTKGVLTPEGLRSLPPHVASDRELAPVLLLLSHPSIAHRVEPYVDIDRRVFEWPELLEDLFLSSGEGRLVLAAVELWSGGGTEPEHTCGLGSLVATLDDKLLRRVLLAVEIYRGWLSLDAALDYLGQP